MGLRFVSRATVGVACSAQRGVSLLFALLALAALSLAAVALVRSVDTGTLLLGNLSFKQDAAAAADRAAEDARRWLRTSGWDLTRDSNDGVGYYATLQQGLDPTGRLTSMNNRALVNWGDADSCACVGPGTCSSCTRLPSNETTYNGVRTRYLITRLCPAAGAVDASNACAQPASSSISDARARGDVNTATAMRPDTTVQVPYYRIIVRTVSGRNTVSFTETIIY